MNTLYGTDFEAYIGECGDGELESEWYSMHDYFVSCEESQCGISTKDSVRMNVIERQVSIRAAKADCSNVISMLFDEIRNNYDF
jgi:hypothetical protein